MNYKESYNSFVFENDFDDGLQEEDFGKKLEGDEEDENELEDDDDNDDEFGEE